MSCWPETHASQVLAGLYSASAREYGDLWAPVLQPTSEHLISAMPLAGASTVLDLGSGTGALLPALHAAAPKARVIGVDRATGMLAEARARGSSTPLAAMDLVQLGIRESVADAAVLAFVLFLIPDPAAALAEVRRVLPISSAGCSRMPDWWSPASGWSGRSAAGLGRNSSSSAAGTGQPAAGLQPWIPRRAGHAW
jgi:trans-aconitate methyltransferase